ncbi:MAG: secondary thiamine-phosphate synthase enzyme YjbQ [Thermodesulfobacteriota bacterium]
MDKCKVYCDSLTLSLDKGVDIKDISSSLEKVAVTSGIKDGMLSACVVGSTASLTTIEYEPGVISDLARTINEMVPPDAVYEHEQAWHDGNGHSHVQAALLGPSISIPVREGRFALGTWQQVVVVNHDNRPRKRRVEVTVFGLL